MGEVGGKVGQESVEPLCVDFNPALVRIAAREEEDALVAGKLVQRGAPPSSLFLGHHGPSGHVACRRLRKCNHPQKMILLHFFIKLITYFCTSPI